MFTIALIGRTNVGKSTLFNRMIGAARAIVSELPHTTRDRNVGTTAWRGVEMRVIDTGGVENLHARGKGMPHRMSRRSEATGVHPVLSMPEEHARPRLTIEDEIRRQVELAVGDADLLILVTDVRDGLLPGEQRISRELRRLGKPIIVACNKASTERLRLACQEFSALALGPVSPIAAITGAGVGDLLDRIMQIGSRAAERQSPSPPLEQEGARGSYRRIVTPPSLPLLQGEEHTTPTIATRIAIVGEPNVGKSSLLNAILGRDEVIVLPEPFTTRDVHDVDIEVDGRTVTLLDTAGIRRLAVRAVRTSRTRIEEIERLAVRRSLAVIERSDVVVLVLDATRTASKHTKQLAQAIIDAGRACVIVVNKMDLMEQPSPSLRPLGPELEAEGGGAPARRSLGEGGGGGAWTKETAAEQVHQQFPHLRWAPIISTSATQGINVPDIVPTAIRSAEHWRRQLETPELAAVHATVKRRIPVARTSFGRKRSHVVELRQTDTAPPWFLLLSRKRIKLPKAIPSIVERAIREHADFSGTPIRITIKSVKA